ncbi:MAG TPA: hypothetical protein VK442_00480 [Xanthobacteraceae bacterium]|nr:hypothetical protein [Xanthobacteraceae bacterium]
MAKRQEAKPDASPAPPPESAAIGGEAPPAQASDSDEALPRVEAPKLDGSEVVMPPAAETASAAPGAPADAEVGETSAAAPPQWSRFALLAATLALAAALGSFVGALSASGFVHFWPRAESKFGMADANALQAMKLELAELAALKANLDGAARTANSQFAKIADRLDRVERAQSEPATKIAHIADAVDRLEKKNAAAAAVTPAAPETTGSVGSAQAPAPEPKVADRILQDWIVQGVQDGHALVENRYGAVFEVAAGNVLPGLGRIETIKRQDGQWVVVTARGLITSDR